MYAAFGEEWGAIGSIALLLVFLAVVLRAFRVAGRQPDLYAKLLATGLAAVFGFQIVIIVGGVLRLFPLTGITLPFVSYGGSSLVTNFLLVALVWAISSERRTAKTPRSAEAQHARRASGDQLQFRFSAADISKIGTGSRRPRPPARAAPGRRRA